MRILHVASISKSLYSGVCVVAPQHIIHQQELAEVALLNVIDCKIDGIKNQYYFKYERWVDNIPSPFKEPDIVIFHEIYYLRFPKMARDLVKKKIPYIIIPHGGLVREAQRIKWYKKIPANLLFFNKFIKACSSIQCLSENELKRIDFMGPKFVGTNGVSLPEVRKSSFREKRIKITFIGRLEIESKGLDLLVCAAKNMRDYLKKKNIVIDVYGPDLYGWHQTLKSLIIKNNVEEVVKLHKSVTGEEKKKVLMDSDMFIQTSRHEGMPMGLLEAMSYGIPCLITKGTSLGDLTSRYNSGWVAETTVKSIGDTIKLAIEESHSFPVKGKNAIKLVADNFSWDKITASTINTYSKLIDSQNK